MLKLSTLAFPLLILILGAFSLLVAALGPGIEIEKLPPSLLLGTWILESGGLLALFLMVDGRCGRWWLDGLVAGWLGWIFRGPLLVITVVSVLGQIQSSWWSLALGWLGLYSLCGLVLATLAKMLEPEPEPPPELEP